MVAHTIGRDLIHGFKEVTIDMEALHSIRRKLSGTLVGVFVKSFVGEYILKLEFKFVLSSYVILVFAASRNEK